MSFKSKSHLSPPLGLIDRSSSSGTGIRLSRGFHTLLVVYWFDSLMLVKVDIDSEFILLLLK